MERQAEHGAQTAPSGTRDCAGIPSMAFIAGAPCCCCCGCCDCAPAGGGGSGGAGAGGGDCWAKVECRVPRRLGRR